MNVPNYLVDVVFCRDVGDILPAFAEVLKLIDLIIEIIKLVTVFPPYGDLFSKICLDCSDYFSHIWVIGVLPLFNLSIQPTLSPFQNALRILRRRVSVPNNVPIYKVCPRLCLSFIFSVFVVFSDFVFPVLVYSAFVSSHLSYGFS